MGVNAPKGRKNLRDKLWGNPKVFRNVQSAAKLIIRKENDIMIIKKFNDYPIGS